MRERLGQALVEAAGDDLGHLEAAHPLLGHPLQRLRLRPVAAQADLQEPVAAHRARLDQPAHRRAVPVQRAELGVAGVGVRVEVDHRDPAPADVPGHAGRVRAARSCDRRRGSPGSRRPAARVHGLLQPAQRQLGVAGRHLDVAGVDDPELGSSGSTPERQVRPGAVVRQVVGEPDRLRAEPAPGRCDVPPSNGAPMIMMSVPPRTPGRPGPPPARRGTWRPGRTSRRFASCRPPGDRHVILPETERSARPADRN